MMLTRCIAVTIATGASAQQDVVTRTRTSQKRQTSSVAKLPQCHAFVFAHIMHGMGSDVTYMIQTS